MAAAMKDAGYFLIVRFWIDAGAEAQVMRWLEGGHVAEVLRQPGFLWCRRLKVAQGGYSMLYGIASREDFDAYQNNKALHDKFNREREPFAQHLRIERFSGEVEFSLEIET